MPIDTSDYYPYTPGSGCDPEGRSDQEEASRKAEEASAGMASAEDDSKASAASPEEKHTRQSYLTHSTIDPASLAAAETEASDSSHNVAGKKGGSGHHRLKVLTSADLRPPHGFMTAFSHVMSWVFSPVLVPTYAIVMVFMLSMLTYAPLSSKLAIIGIVFALTGVIPAFAVWFLTRYGDVSDVELSQRSDRLIPYIVEGACMLACGYYLTTTGLPDWVGYFFIGAAVATGVNMIINFWWKISAHGAGMGGFIAMILVMNRYGLPAHNLWGWCMGAVLLGGLLGMARVWLGRHTPMQTVCGEIVGFVGVLSMELFLPITY